MKILFWMNIIHYAVAKIEFKNANQMNEITRLRSQIPSNEYVTDESEQDHPVLSVGSNLYIPGTLKPETVLSRPYNNQKNIRYIQKLRSRNNIVAYNPNNLSLYLNKGSVVEFGKSHEKGGAKTKLSSIEFHISRQSYITKIMIYPPIPSTLFIYVNQIQLDLIQSRRSYPRNYIDSTSSQLLLHN